MRFAITSNDRYLGVFAAFVQAGWQPLRLITTPVKNGFDSQHAVIAYAEKLNVDVQFTKLTKQDLDALHNQACDVLILAGYDWRMIDWQPYFKYAVNFHASPLPEARGPYPAIRAILEDKDQWGITCHKVSPAFDEGDILAKEMFPLQSDECHESLDLKIQMAAKKLATHVASRFTELWERAEPQKEGSYWKSPTVNERVIDFQASVDTVLRHIRAFGATGTLAKINDTWLTVKLAVGWSALHQDRPGYVVHVFNRFIVVAVMDGYIALLDTEITPASIAAQL